MSFHQPSPPPARTIPSIPVRFEFRVEILAARARRKRGKERKMAISAGSAPPPPLFHSGFRGASWKRRNNVIDLPIENFSFEKIALLRFRDHFFLPARSFVVEGVDFFLSGVGLGWRPRGETLRKVSKGMECPRSRLASTDFNPLPHPPPRGVETRTRRRRLANSSKE